MQIVGPDGRPLSRPPTLVETWSAIPPRLKAVFIAMVAFLALLSAAVGSIAQIWDFMDRIQHPTTVPATKLLLVNKLPQAITIKTRARFHLVPPDQKQTTVVGKYEITQVEDAWSDELVIDSGAEREVELTLTDQPTHAPILERGSYDLELGLLLGERELKLPSRPFTLRSLKSTIRFEINEPAFGTGPALEKSSVWTAPIEVMLKGVGGGVKGEEPSIKRTVTVTIPEGAQMLAETAEFTGGTGWGRWEGPPVVGDGGRTISRTYKSWYEHDTTVRGRVQYILPR